MSIEKSGTKGSKSMYHKYRALAMLRVENFQGLRISGSAIYFARVMNRGLDKSHECIGGI